MSLLLKYSSIVVSINGHFCQKEQVKVVIIVYLRQILQRVLKLNMFVNGFSGIEPLAVMVFNGCQQLHWSSDGMVQVQNTGQTDKTLSIQFEISRRSFGDHVVKLLNSEITSSCWFEQGRVKNMRDTYCLEAGVFQESVKDAF